MALDRTSTFLFCLLAGYGVAADCGSRLMAAEPKQLYQVDKVGIAVSADRATITLCVEAAAATPGFTNIRLDAVSTSLPADGAYEFRIAGDAPGGIVPQALTLVTLTHVWRNPPPGVTAVRILAIANGITATLDAAPGGCGLASDTGPQLSGSTWLVENIKGQGVIGDPQPAIEFLGEGRIAGNAGCNRMMGTYRIAPAAAKLSFGPLATTRKLCPPAIMDQESKLLAALGEVSGFGVEQNVMTMRTADGSVIITLIRR